jgi:[pyruvate, water dikinase]-phosphate phosphotransferase / [pyruvate, water dikinase] kinase
MNRISQAMAELPTGNERLPPSDGYQAHRENHSHWKCLARSGMRRRCFFVLIPDATDSIPFGMIVPVSMWTVLQRLRGGACSSVTGMALSSTIHRVQRQSPMSQRNASFFHLHLVSDSTGETLITVARAASAQYVSAAPVEHVYPAVRTNKQLDRVLADIEASPGVILYTLLDQSLIGRLEDRCRELGLPCLSVLGPVLRLFQSYLGAESTHKIGAQHILNADYFKRIDALNYTMMHDDGQLADDLENADVILVGVSRTSKTPTSIYLANRGVKTANIPLVPGMPPPVALEAVRRPMVVGLFASPERIVQIRQNRLLGLNAHRDDDQYIDRQAVAEEIAFSRRLCSKHEWPLIDVTRRSIEETAAAIMSLLADRRRLPAQ